MPKYFDIHSHLNFKDFDRDREIVIGQMQENDVWTMCVGTDWGSSRSAIELAEKHENIFVSIGIHPVDDPKVIWEEEKFEELINHPKVVAVGECGLDFFHTDKAQDFERQKKLFSAQVEFALKHNKPLMIHSRDAYDELIEILSVYKKDNPKLRGDIHFFSGNLVQAKQFVALGFTLSFDGPITFVRDYDEVIKNIPLEFIMAETDAPFAAPVPYRGKRNEPSYVSEVVKKIAEIRGEDLEVVNKALVTNALNMIGY